MLIRYYGHVGHGSGYAAAGADFCMAILSAGIDLEISTTGRELPIRFGRLLQHIRNEEELSPRPDVIIVHTLPLSCGDLLSARRLRETGAQCVAYTTWEGCSPAPAEIVASLDGFDQVWVPSVRTAAVLMQGGMTNNLVEVVPHAYDEAYWAPRPRPESSLYRFYYIGAWTVRKNPQGVVQAFMRAFGRFDDAELILQSSGVQAEQVRMVQISTGIPQEDWPAVRLSNERVSDDAIRDLHASCDCFVSASRGESWNLPAFEAMLMRRHIIVPKGQGTDDFLGWDTSAWLYNARMAPAGGEIFLGAPVPGQSGVFRAQYVGTQGLTAKQDWWDPDIAQLAMHMRRAYAEKHRTLDVRYDPADRYSTSAVGALIKHLLQGNSHG